VPAVIAGSLIARITSPRWLQVALALVLLAAAAKSIAS
jgi:general stress protein CsbA